MTEITRYIYISYHSGPSGGRPNKENYVSARHSQQPLNDVSIQADLRVAEPTSYESEDETMGRRKQSGRLKRGTPTYSKQDIREQYCINDRQLLGLEDQNSGLFGCLSSYQDSSCSSRSPSLLTVCVRRRIPSDENLAELVRRPMAEYAPFPRWIPPYPPIHAYHSPAHPPMKFYHDHYPPSFYADDEEQPCRMHVCNQDRPRPLREFPEYPPRRFLSYSSEYLIGRHEPCPAHPHVLPPPPPPPSVPPVVAHRAGTLPRKKTSVRRSKDLEDLSRMPKHVSFARSHTMQSFDDTVSFGSGSCITSCSQERLIDGKKSSESPKVIVMEKSKRAPMKTQATQTEVCLGRKPLPPNYLSLSPRTVQRVRMVSQGAQTNGDKAAATARKLMKSFSEVGKFGTLPTPQPPPPEVHEPLQRTQSEEPRSPFLPPNSPKEIFINFEPLEKKQKKKLAKSVSDGEILESKGGIDECEPCTLSDGELASAKSTQEGEEEDQLGPTIAQHLQPPTPRKLATMDSQEEEFHENLIYQNIFRQTRTDSLESPVNGVDSNGLVVTSSPSPFASCDSLNTKDHSDGIWNESQMTVLQGDSDNNGAGTGLSCSDLSSTALTPVSTLGALTPSSKRKHQLLLQHQQRSSMDTETLDQEELLSETIASKMESPPPLPPKPKPEPIHSIPTVAVTTPNQEKPPEVMLRPIPTRERIRKREKKKKNRTRYVTMDDSDIVSSVKFDVKVRKFDRPISPQKLRRRSPGARTPESEPHHSSSATLSSNEAFARSDSGRTNTDMSEASTTDDYATATENNSDGSSRLKRDQEQFVPGTGNGSFESGSSLYSLTRADATEEQHVPCSPPLVEDEGEDKTTESADDKAGEGDGDTSSPESSSCGSYSVEGSSDKLGHSDKSGQCSSTGGYDSPFEDRKQRKWTSEEKSKVKKAFKLELPTSTEQPENVSVVPAKPQLPKKPAVGSSEIVKEKTPTVKSPSSAAKRPSIQMTKEITSPGKSQGLQEAKREDWPHRLTPDEKKGKISNGIGPHDSSDETSDECDKCGKNKRRETLRRKTPAARSPTAHSRRKSVSGEEVKRRSSMIPTKSPSPVTLGEDPLHPSRLSPRSALSPGGSPSRTPHGYKGIASPETTRLKALSAESLRSVSPGSDSVFYSEPSSNTVTDKSQPPCHHCGRHYAEQTKAQQAPEKAPIEIVQPPAGFEDSPRTPHRQRLYKKADKRYRSEERRHRMHAEAARAKSEERASQERKEKVRPLTRSTDASMEKLNTQSSFDDDDEWQGVMGEAFKLGSWVYIGGTEELNIWRRPDSREGEIEEKERGRKDSLEATQSEEEFRRKYQAITHRMVHRKSSLEMYKRLASKCFEPDKRVMVRRVSGEFGFRIHGSRPVVVSCIEAGTPAESSGLEVGDIIISVNNTNVLDSTHSDVVKLAHGGSDVLEVEVARTCDRMGRGTPSPPVIAGCLYRLSNSSKTKSWILRYFVLKKDHYLYHYKSESGGQPLGAINLTEYTVVQVADPERPHSFKVWKKGTHPVFLAALSASELDQWLIALSEACKPQLHSWDSPKALGAPPTKILRPDCAGTLSTLIHHRGKTWKRRFCILKDACLYLYADINAESALGLICLHGYRVQSSTSASRKFSFELVPPEPPLLHLYFYTDTELDKKRWLAALEYSIDRWVKVG